MTTASMISLSVQDLADSPMWAGNARLTKILTLLLTINPQLLTTCSTNNSLVVQLQKEFGL